MSLVRSSLRFTSAEQVFATFRSCGDEISARPSRDPPLLYLSALALSETPEDAITFAAYLLPRREAVWWAYQCLRGMGSISTDSDRMAATFAERWVREPDEEQRRAALDFGMAGRSARAATWLALAAGWSGGSMAPAESPPVPPPPHLTAQAARAAVLMALAEVNSADRAAQLAACVERCVALVCQVDGSRSAGG